MAPSTPNTPISLSSPELEAEVVKITQLFIEKETEQNWTKFSDCLLRFTFVTLGSFSLSNFISCVKRIKAPIIQSLTSERTRLARCALNLIESLASSLLEKYDLISDLFSPTVYKLCARANKIYVSSAHSVLLACIKATSGLTTMIPVWVDAKKNPSKTMRIVAGDCLVHSLTASPTHKLEPFVEKIEECIKNNIVDSFEEVRDLTRSLFEIYKEHFDDRVQRLIQTLPENSKKYLKIEATFSKQQPALKPKISKPKLSTTIDAKKIKPSTEVGMDVKSNVTVKSASQELLPRSAPTAIRKRAESVAQIKNLSNVLGGGAMRVPREIMIASQDSIRLNSAPIKALRVPTIVGHAATAAEEEEIPSVSIPVSPEKSLLPASAAEDNNSTLHRVHALGPMKTFARKPEFKSPSKSLNISELIHNFSSSDWYTRTQVFESIETQINSNFKLSPKIVDLFSQALDDNHFRVAQACIKCISSLLNHEIVIENLYIKILKHIYRSKISPPDSQMKMALKYTNLLGEVAISLLFKALEDNNSTLKGRILFGLISNLISVDKEVLKSYILRHNNFTWLIRHIINISSITDSEVNMAEFARSFFEIMHSSNNESFCSSFTSLSATEQISVGKFFGMEDFKNDTLSIAETTHSTPKHVNVESRIPISRSVQKKNSLQKLPPQTEEISDTVSSNEKVYKFQNLESELPNEEASVEILDEIEEPEDHAAIVQTFLNQLLENLFENDNDKNSEPSIECILLPKPIDLECNENTSFCNEIPNEEIENDKISNSSMEIVTSTEISKSLIEPEKFKVELDKLQIELNDIKSVDCGSIAPSAEPVEVYESDIDETIKVILNCIQNDKEDSEFVKHCLIYLREIIPREWANLLQKSSDILECVLRCNIESRCNTEEILTFGYLIDQVIQRYQDNFDDANVFKGVMNALEKGLNCRICFMILKRVMVKASEEIKKQISECEELQDKVKKEKSSKKSTIRIAAKELSKICGW